MTSEPHSGAYHGRLLGLEAAATYLDTTERSVRRLIARGVLQAVHIPTLRRVLLDREDLDRLINAAKAEATL
ncbi:MAG TPA: helix-turn-helix domain-containing protein [Candidatus Tectomicrobia bacterium]